AVEPLGAVEAPDEDRETDEERRQDEERRHAEGRNRARQQEQENAPPAVAQHGRFGEVGHAACSGRISGMAAPLPGSNVRSRYARTLPALLRGGLRGALALVRRCRARRAPLEPLDLHALDLPAVG